jgi:hypothetical protein
LDEEHSLASGIFLVTLFFAAEKRVTGSKGFGSKTIRTMARSVLLILKIIKRSAGPERLKPFYFVCKAL